MAAVWILSARRRLLERRIQVFGLDGTPLRTIGSAGNGPGEFNAPSGVVVTPNGDVLVANFYNQRIQHLRADGSFIRQWGDTGKVGIWAGQFNYPTDVALSGEGTLYVADGFNDRIQVFTPSGGFSHKWGGPLALNIYGPFNGWFITVTGISIDGEGNVFVVDHGNHLIQKFASDGTFLTAFGEHGKGPEQFDRPTAVSVASDGTVFVVDHGNHRIQKWRPSTDS